MPIHLSFRPADILRASLAIHASGVIRRLAAYARDVAADGVAPPRAAMALAITMMLAALSAMAPGSAAAQGAAQGTARQLKLVALGDSLTAGYNLPAAAAFPSVLQAMLRARGHAVTIENAGVSGDTAQAGLDRLDWSVGDGVDGVILELGANDALRGVDPAQTKAALETIIQRLTARGVPVMLAGMRAPPNLGAAYVRRFDAIFPDLAARHRLVLYPFFLDGVAGEAQLNQRDGIHPTADGVRIIAGRILPSVEAFIATLPARR